MDYKKGLVLGSVFLCASLCSCGDDSSTSSLEYDYEIVGDSSGSTSELSIESSFAEKELPPNEPESSEQQAPLASSASPFPVQSSENSAPEISSSTEESSSSENPEESSSSEASSSSIKLLDFNFYRGADISTVQEYERFNADFYDVDGKKTDIFTLLKNHGFNAIRLKNFVSPQAKYGYAAAGCDHDAEAYADKDHVVAYAQKIKAAGMAFLLDIHYSDNWADPGKQTIPSRWRSVQSSDAMADSVYNYTYDLMNALRQVDAIPEMVQIGNETTPGILMHVPNSGTNCWGDGVDLAPASVSGNMGTSSGKANAGKYFRAGIRAVKAVSPSTKTVLHIESIRKPNNVNWWMTEIFKNQNVPADIMGFSAYTAYGDGPPDNWVSLFKSLTLEYPNLEFIVAEYNGGDKENHYPGDGSRKRTDEMVRSLDRWIGAFFWEPTMSGAWGSALFDWNGKDLYADKDAFDEYRVNF